MNAIAQDERISTMQVEKSVQIDAPPDIVFDALLDQIGPLSEMPGGQPFPMKIEPWPGGRWYRDLGNDAGHLWGHVQVIKPPTLLEICGPMFMSYPATSHIQYRLTPEGGGTRLKLVHRAMGLILDEHRDGVGEGWEYEIQKIRELAEKRRHDRKDARG